MWVDGYGRVDRGEWERDWELYAYRLILDVLINNKRRGIFCGGEFLLFGFLVYFIVKDFVLYGGFLRIGRGEIWFLVFVFEMEGIEFGD